MSSILKGIVEETQEGGAVVLLLVVVLYGLAGVVALLASVGVGPFGPFDLHGLALALLAAGLAVCHLPPRVHA